MALDITPEDEMLTEFLKTRIRNALTLCEQAIDEAKEGHAILARLLYTECISLMYSTRKMLEAYTYTTTTTIPANPNVIAALAHTMGIPSLQEETEASLRTRVEELEDILEKIREKTGEEEEETTEEEEEKATIEEAEKIARKEFKEERRTPPPEWTPKVEEEELGEEQEEEEEIEWE